MNTILLALLIFVAVGVGLWLVSLVMEALRQKPRPPATLRWSPDIPIRTIDIGGAKLRYIKSGKGPVLILLHTLRTQLDLFEKVDRSFPSASPSMLSTIQGTAIRTFRRPVTMRLSSPKRSKASLISSTCATSRSRASRSAERSPSSSPRVATLEWRALSPSTPTTTPRAAAWGGPDCSEHS
jgi:hypothetical protein